MLICPATEVSVFLYVFIFIFGKYTMVHINYYHNVGISTRLRVLYYQIEMDFFILSAIFILANHTKVGYVKWYFVQLKSQNIFIYFTICKSLQSNSNETICKALSTPCIVTEI